MSQFELGQRVRFGTELHRGEQVRLVDRSGRTRAEHWRVWKKKASPSREGVVVGVRTLLDCNREYIGYEEGWDNNLSTAERFQAVMVSYDLRRKPAFVLPEDLEPLS